MAGQKSLIQRIKNRIPAPPNFAAVAANLKGFIGMEGSPRGPFYGQGELGGWYPIDPIGDGFQSNLTRPKSQSVAAVYAAVMLNARAVSQCIPSLMKTDENGTWTRSLTAPAARILRQPNTYESMSQMLLNTVAEMGFEGESIWYAPRDERYVIKEVHRIPNKAWTLYVDPESNDIFYGINQSGNDLVRVPDYLIPARDIAHFRQYTPRHPLIGESPAAAAALAIGINVALSRSQMQFFSQMNRPSGVLYSDKNLSPEQIRQLRALFNEQSKNINQGEMPILGLGLKYQPMGIAQSDSQLIEQQRLSIADIARVYGVPMTLLSEQSGPQGGTEALINNWISIGLGSLLETIERTLDMLFRVPISQTVQLDTTPLLRADTDARLSAWSKGVQGGIMTVNEARAKEHLPPIDGGDQAFLQRQMTPVNLLNDLAAKELIPPEPAPAPPPPMEPGIDPEVLRGKIETMKKRLRVEANGY